MVVLVPGTDRRELAGAAAEVHRRAAELHPDQPVVVVLGSSVDSAPRYPIAYRTARGAAQLAGAGVLDVDELGVAAMLLEIGVPAGLRALADRLIGPLERYDRARESSLVETLQAWLRSGCATADTGRRLHVHPHTVNYRLRQIARLTGVDPQHRDAVFELQVALMVRAAERATGRSARNG